MEGSSYCSVMFHSKDPGVITGLLWLWFVTPAHKAQFPCYTPMVLKPSSSSCISVYMKRIPLHDKCHQFWAKWIFSLDTKCGGEWLCSGLCGRPGVSGVEGKLLSTAMVGMLFLPQIDTHVSATYRVPISYHNFIKQDRCTCFPLLDTACLAFSCNNHTSSCLHMHCGRSMQTSAWHKNREAFASLEVHHWVWSAL